MQMEGGSVVDILVIDDDDGARATVVEMLQAMGHAVTDAPDGQTGQQLYRERIFDLVVSDLLMPEPDGLATLKALRFFDPKVRVLAMSGGGPSVESAPLLEAALKLGACGVLPKPFDMQALERSISDALS
jgi:two-component system chemotaxis response regulator CheY